MKTYYLEMNDYLKDIICKELDNEDFQIKKITATYKNIKHAVFIFYEFSIDEKFEFYYKLKTSKDFIDDISKNYPIKVIKNKDIENIKYE